MASPSPVRLLIADASENRAHELDSVLRNAGIATRPEYCPDMDSAVEAVARRHPDIVLCNSDLNHFDRLLAGLRERQPDLPIILMNPGNEVSRLTEGMALGATDVVFEEDRERLLYVFRREMHHVCQRHSLKATRRALEEAERRCQLLLSNSETAIAYVHEGMHIHANEDYLSLFGFSDADDLLGLPLLDLVASECADDFKAKMKAFRASETELTFAFTGCSTNGDPVIGELTLSNAEYEGESCTQVMVRRRAAIDEPANAAANGAAENGAQSNGFAMAEEAAAGGKAEAAPGHGVDLFVAMLEADKEPSASAIMMATIDGFDAIQAEHGLKGSEDFAVQVCTSLQEAAPKAAVLRVGEHTYAIATHTSSSKANEALAESLRAAVEGALFEINNKTVRCTITVGALAAGTFENVLSALDVAFRTMINARINGSNNEIHWYQPERPVSETAMESNLDKRAMLERINHAIDNDRFQLLFQPIISLRGDSDEHYEVFLRMLDGAGKQIRPDQFLQIAIDHGVAIKIDRWVILQSIKMLSFHRSKGHNTRLTINLSSNSLHDEEFARWLAVAIKAARLPSDAVIFQVTEPDCARYMRQAKSFVKAVKALHCRTSLSHFGQTNTGFDTLKHLSVDFVKVDGGMVLEVKDDAQRRKSLTVMIEELQGLGKLTIVPMVESASELSALWQAGANYIQGHYLQEPSAEMNYDFASDD